MTDTLVLWNAARQALALASTVDELKDVRDRAEAIRAYAQQRGEAHPMLCDIAEVKLGAERRLGDLLAENPDIHQGGAPRLHDVTLADLGLTKIESHRWQKEALVPEEDYVQYLATARASDRDEPTSAGLYRLAQKRLQKPRTVDHPLPEGKYRCVVIDPPWPIQKILRTAAPHQDAMPYPLMTLERIAALPIQDLTWKDGCHIYLWTTHKFLPAALAIFQTWKVRYQCLLTWVKNVGFTPFSWMYSTEHVLFGRIGSLALLEKGIRLDFRAKRRKHSQKPDVFYEIVCKASPGPRLEMFAREPHEGFVSWGDEVDEEVRDGVETGSEGEVDITAAATGGGGVDITVAGTVRMG